MRELPPGLTIRHTTEADLADVARLWADPEVMRWVGYPGGLRLTDEELRRWLAWAEESPDRRHFVVSDDEIGFCGELFSAVDRGTGRAALDVKLLPAARGRGVATAALRWLVDLVFESEPDVELVWTEPWPENEAAMRLYARCGLRPGPRPGDLAPGPSFWARARADPEPDERTIRSTERTIRSTR
ncbi:MAG TPA: GNAT family N-acetyltransferase [Gaiellaceae bacterium]|nr:GNAT family N-acetyltransferase [Gaiellaceae bacterium]